MANRDELDNKVYFVLPQDYPLYENSVDPTFREAMENLIKLHKGVYKVDITKEREQGKYYG